MPLESRSDGRLRDKQTQLTRDLVLDALATVVAEQGGLDFAVQEVADRAGVSHRTVYRHFQTREAMLDALVTRLRGRMAALGGTDLPTQVDDIVPAIRAKFAALEEVGDAYPALVQLVSVRRARDEMSARSAEAVRTALADTTSHLPLEVADHTIALIYLIGSSRTWRALRETAGHDGAVVADVVAWAMSTLIAELEAGRGPGVT